MFNNIIGNDKIKELLVNSVKNNKISHSYLFLGTEGIGKKMIAKEFAKMILCTDDNKILVFSQFTKVLEVIGKRLNEENISYSYLDGKTSAKDRVKLVEEFNTNNNPDFKIIEPDGNSLKIDQIREFQTRVAEKPIISNKKVYIINDSDKMTR